MTDAAVRWQSFAGHRKKITELLTGPLVSGSARLCVLGAGYCDDLDLVKLRQAYGEIHLVDLDADALARGVAHQGLEADTALRCFGGLELTGMLDLIRSWSLASAISNDDLAACILKPIERICPILAGPFDVVASTCLVSQLINTVMHAISERHPRFPELIQAIRLGHLRLLSQIIAPGGFGFLITDLVSSETLPGLAAIPDELLAAALVEQVNRRNFFHGVNPAVLLSLFHTDPALAREIADAQLTSPWRWDAGARLYAVYAITFRKVS